MWRHLPRNSKHSQSVRSHLRANMPAPEAVLWERIRGEQLGVKFRRQHAIGNAITDFYAPSVRLVIEVDGESHFENPVSQRHDRIRDALLARDGISVLRFTNREVMENLNGVCDRIRGVVVARLPTTPSQSPPPRTEGEKKLKAT